MINFFCFRIIIPTQQLLIHPIWSPYAFASENDKGFPYASQIKQMGWISGVHTDSYIGSAYSPNIGLIKKACSLFVYVRLLWRQCWLSRKYPIWFRRFTYSEIKIFSPLESQDSFFCQGISNIPIGCFLQLFFNFLNQLGPCTLPSSRFSRQYQKSKIENQTVFPFSSYFSSKNQSCHSYFVCPSHTSNRKTTRYTLFRFLICMR